jgi:hypothetical protein
VERATAAPILPDVAVDGLVADAQGPGPAKPAGDLLGAPVLAETGLHEPPVPARETLIAAGAAAPPAGEVIGQGGPAGAAVTVPTDLAGHSAAGLGRETGRLRRGEVLVYGARRVHIALLG